MHKINVFKHADGSLSAPFCNLGEAFIRQWYFKGQCSVITEGDPCDNPNCSCNNNSPLVEKVSANDKNTFYLSIKTECDV